MQFIQCILNITTYCVLSIMYDKYVLLFVIIPDALFIYSSMQRKSKQAGLEACSAGILMSV